MELPKPLISLSAADERIARLTSKNRQLTMPIDQIADSGVAILMISSELPELIGISDRVYVMREGGVVSELEAGPDLTQERVVAYMV